MEEQTEKKLKTMIEHLKKVCRTIIKTVKQTARSRVVTAMWNTAREMCIRTFRTIQKEMSKIVCVLQVLLPVILLYIYYKYNINILQLIGISILYNCLFSYVKHLGYNLNNTLETGLPIPVRKFTKTDSTGFIECVNEDDAVELLQYMSELEAYLESKGAL